MTTQRLTAARRRAQRQAREVADAFLEQRLSLALSQTAVATSSDMSRNHYADIEAAKVTTVSLDELNRIASSLGLDLSVRAYPGGVAVRDAGQSTRLLGFLNHCAPPLTWRMEVPLPAVADRWERRAWDAMLFGNGERTAIELEMRLRDVQAVRRRHALKRRDDPTDRYLLLLADTRHNRRIVGELAELFVDLPRLRPRAVRSTLAAGIHPPTGHLFV